MTNKDIIEACHKNNQKFIIWWTIFSCSPFFVMLGLFFWCAL